MSASSLDRVDMLKHMLCQHVHHLANSHFPHDLPLGIGESRTAIPTPVEVLHQMRNVASVRANQVNG